MTSASNERQIKARVEQQKRDRLTDETVVRALMASADGRRWVWLRLAEAQLFIEDADLDPYRMAFAKGIKQFALRLLRDVNRFTPREYVTMTEENTGIELRLARAERPLEEVEDE